MSRAYARFPSNAGIDIPDGGVIQSTGEDAYSPSVVACTQTGVGFGPLYVGVPDGGSYCSLKSVTFLPDEDDGGDGILFFGITSAGGAKAAKEQADEGEAFGDTEDNRATRRTILGLAAAALAAAITGRARAANSDDLAALHVGELDVEKSTAPMTIRVLDIVEEVLPPTTEIMVDADATRVGEISDPSTGVTLPASTTGKVSVYLRDSKGRLDRILAWAAGVVGGDEEIEYSRELPKEASEYDEGQFVKLSEHPALVKPVEESDPGETVLKIGNTSIPHNDDGASEAGSYGIFDGALIYEVGPNPPSSAEWSLRTRLGTLAAINEKYL